MFERDQAVVKGTHAVPLHCIIPQKAEENVELNILYLLSLLLQLFVHFGDFEQQLAVLILHTPVFLQQFIVRLVGHVIVILGSGCSRQDDTTPHVNIVVRCGIQVRGLGNWSANVQCQRAAYSENLK